MDAVFISRIRNNPKFIELERKRNSFSWTLAILMIAIYGIFIGLVAFDQSFMAQPIGVGPVTMAFPLGLGVIATSIILTGVYVVRANSGIRPADAGDRRAVRGTGRAAAIRPVWDRAMIGRLLLWPGMLLLALSGAAHAAGPDLGQAEKQPLNVVAISLFLLFVLITLGITYWAARRTRTAADFYAAGGGITGLQNGLAIAGDYMSAASFLGIAALVYANGYDGLIYSIGFLVGWPIVMFLMAERCATWANTPSRTSCPIGSRPRRCGC